MSPTIVKPRVARPTFRRGIALVEALVAVVLLAVGLLGAIGMQARSYSALADTGMRAEATMAADKLIGVMAFDQANLASYALASGAAPGARIRPWYDETRAHIPGAVISVALVPAAASTRVTIRIGWTRKSGEAGYSHTITSYIANAK